MMESNKGRLRKQTTTKTANIQHDTGEVIDKEDRCGTEVASLVACGGQISIFLPIASFLFRDRLLKNFTF